MHTPPKETCNYTIFVNQSHFNINFKILTSFNDQNISVQIIVLNLKNDC